MEFYKRIQKINEVVEAWFKRNSEVDKVAAKELMLDFIAAGIYKSNHKDGLPLRNDLRALDESNELHLIKQLTVERKDKNRHWYFVQVQLKSAPKVLLKSEKKSEPGELLNNSKKRDTSDEAYIIDLCDEVLKRKAQRQKRFTFLRGDTGTQLPVDAYYELINLVIEYREKQHTESVSFFDKRITKSGVSRGEQRKIYDERRKEELPKYGITLIEFDYAEFQHSTSKRLKRNRELDLVIIKKKLQFYI